MADSNPFLQRSERSDDVPFAADNPFATPASRAAASAALTAAVSAASNPSVQRAAATGSTLVQHGVDSGWSVKVGSVWLPGCCGGESVRVPVRWHLTLVAVPLLTLANVFYNGLHESNGQSGITNLFMNLVNVPLLILAVLLHEIGHLLVAKAHGMVPKAVVLWPLGGLTVHHGPDASLGQRIRIALAGPLMHVPMAAAWMGLFASTGCRYSVGVIGYEAGQWVVAAGIFAAQAELNVTLLLFNLLVPCTPLDAATILVCLLAGCGLPHVRVAKVVVAVASLALCCLCVAVLLALLSGRFDPTLSLLATLCCAWRTRKLHRAVGNGVAAVQKHPLFKTLPPDPTRDGDGGGAGGGGGGGGGARSRVASLFRRGGGDEPAGLRVATAPVRPAEPTEAQRMFGVASINGTAPLEAPRPNAIWPPPSFQPD